MSNPDWRLTVSGQHQMWATITGFSITGIIILASLSSPFTTIIKVALTVALALLFIQIILLLSVAEIERRTAFQENQFLQNLENILRLILNFVTVASWLAITILILIAVWGNKK
ncbi:MAG: hypothetical protein AAB649_05805 [Patescibacteria group bacterium]